MLPCFLLKKKDMVLALEVMGMVFVSEKGAI